jgi:uncharacterized protein
MKILFLSILFAFAFCVQAQQGSNTGQSSNILLNQSFWQEKPGLNIVKAEVEKGANPAELNAMSFDPVVMAINAGAPTESILYLLEQKGNDVNKLTHDSRTYIFWSASRGNADVVEYLIKKGAKVNMEDSHGATPVGFAAGAGQQNTRIYDLLANAGADMKQRNRDGASLLMLGIANDKDLTLTNYFISKGLSLKDVDAAGNTVFNYAARTGNIEFLKTLIQKGVKYTDNAILMASQGTRGGPANGVEVYQYLESLNLKPTAVNSNGENVLHSLVRRPNQIPVINYFISKGVDVNQPDKEGNTAFMNATSTNRDTATIALLLTKVKNINQVNGKGMSALAMAVRSNSADVVQMLLSKGADMNVTDADGNNLAYYLIQSYGAQGGGRQAGNGPRVDDFGLKMKLLQEKGYDLTTPQKDGNTLYHLAIAKNDLTLLKRLENLHVDVNGKNREGLTPLHKAAMVSKDDAVLKYLVSIGAKKEVATEFKETAYDLAKENEFFSKNNVSVDFLK